MLRALCLLTFTANAATLSISAPDWTRIEVHGPGGKLHQPSGALRDTTARARTGLPFYPQSFICKSCSLDLPAGQYRIVAERGPEFERIERAVTLTDAQPLTVTLSPKRWINMREQGWYSGDFHVHRPLDDLATLAEAEDLNLTVAFTMWNRRNLWQDRPIPADPVTQTAPHRLLSLMNAEDERGGGAWMLHNIPQPIDLAFMLQEGKPQTESWFPAGLRFIRQIREWRKKDAIFPWFDCEKPIWWEVPVVMALDPPDSFGLLHNHFNQYGILDMEAWGRPRDQRLFPGNAGHAEYTMGLYYRYLNLGFRIPPSAGSASGVLPNPVGYNRIYARIESDFTIEKFYAALRDHRHFVTNGPMLFLSRDSVEVRSRDPIDRIEVIANGRIVQSFRAPANSLYLRRAFSVDARRHSWYAVRAFIHNANTVRLAHSAPVYLPGRWDASEDARYFIDWIDQLVANITDTRVPDPAQRDELLSYYRMAREFYATNQRERIIFGR